MTGEIAVSLFTSYVLKTRKGCAISAISPPNLCWPLLLERRASITDGRAVLRSKNPEALGETPDQPKENELRRSYDEGRQLSPDRERQLVDSFAFISASTDNMLRVMAVCIEEDPDKTGMTIRLASNTGDLSYVTQGFNSIARILEQASLKGRA